MTGLYVASNPTALTAKFSLTNNMADLATTLTRLSTGLKINSGKDDPAGLIASELLKAEITGTNQAISNTQRANSMIATADSAMGQIGNLLNDIKGLVVEAANTGAMSADQIAANQLQVDASLEAIDRIARSTTYAGNKLLDGSMGFSTDLCGDTNSNGINNLQINAANFGTANKIDVTVNVQETAKKGTLIYNGNGVDEKTTLDITGSSGTKSFTFGAGTTTAEMAAAIAASSDSTGVTAYVEGAASRGTVTLNGTGANNGIVITANEEGTDAGNYSFRIVSGDTNDVRIASQPTGSTAGVVEIMLAKSYSKSHNNVGNILDVTINGNGTVDSSGVTIKKGTTNLAVYHETASSATATSADGQKTISINGAATASNAAIAYTDMSKLNGWTFKVVDTNTNVNGQAVAADGAVYDDEAKIAYLSSDNDAEASLSAAVSRITGTETALNADGSGLSITGTLVSGDSFTLENGGAAGELELTYKEGASVDDLLKLANNASGKVSASLASGVNGSTLISNLLTGNSRSFATSMMPSQATSSTTANDVVALINSRLGDKFTASLLSGDTGTGLMTYMDAAVDYGSINSDNAIRFTGMDSGPIVRMVTTDSNGNSIANQKLSVKLINPTEADIANGIATPILQINLATDAAGNSITTASDIVALFNSLTPEQTGGISATLLLPDGVDPNGRTWMTDECGNVTEVVDCNAKYGTGIVQPTGTPGICEIQQNDLVLLGSNQVLEYGYPVARIPSASSITTVAAHATNANETVSLLFENTSALNGLSFAFTSDAAKAGFDSTTGLLTVFVSSSAIAKTDADFTTAMVELINGQIQQDWESIRQFTNATGNAVSVQGVTYGTDYTDLMALIDSNSADAVLSITGNSAGSVATSGFVEITSTNGGIDTGNATYQLKTDSPTGDLNGLEIRLRSSGGHDYIGGILYVQIGGNQGSASQAAEEIVTAINNALTSETSFTARIASPATIGSDDGNITNYDATDFDGKTFKLNGGSTPGLGGNGGVAANDAALILTAIKPGTPQSGAHVLFIQDPNAVTGTIDISYDEENKLLTVTGNPTGGILDASVLADLLNENETYRKYFQEIDLVTDVTPGATVAFEPAGTAHSYTFTGGYEIVTESNPAMAANSNATATSAGIGMVGGSDDNQRLVLQAVDAGSENFVKVSVAEGSFRTFCPLGYEMCELAGTDVVATINGIAATGRGNEISINSSDLAMSMTTNGEVGTTSFSITGGGALFQLGSNVVSAQQIRIGIGSMMTTQLGGTSGKLFQLKTGGHADLITSDASRVLADKIVNEAISYVANTRGRLGAIQKSSLDPNISVLQDSLVALTEAESSYSNADFAEESSNLTRLQLLVQSGMSTLGIANQFPQYAASLVR